MSRPSSKCAPSRHCYAPTTKFRSFDRDCTDARDPLAKESNSISSKSTSERALFSLFARVSLGSPRALASRASWLRWLENRMTDATTTSAGVANFTKPEGGFGAALAEPPLSADSTSRTLHERRNKVTVCVCVFLRAREQTRAAKHPPRSLVLRSCYERQADSAQVDN